MKVDKVKAPSLNHPIDPTCLRFVCISDTHNRNGLQNLHVPDGDVLLHAGDFSMVGRPEEIIQFNDFLGEFVSNS